MDEEVEFEFEIPDGESFENALDCLLIFYDRHLAETGRKLTFYVTDRFEDENGLSDLNLFQKNLPREEVFLAVNKYTKPEKISVLKNELERRFPKDKFESTFPYCKSLEIVYQYLLENRKS